MYDLQFIYNLVIGSFTDTELAEDIIEYFLWSDLSCDFAEGRKTVLQVHTEELSADLHLKSVLYVLDGLLRAYQCLIVACVADGDRIAQVVLLAGVVQ